MNISDYFKGFFFILLVSDVRTIDVLDSENQPGSGKIRTGSGDLALTGDVRHQKHEIKKEGF